jgi:hypothetical protein
MDDEHQRRYGRQQDDEAVGDHFGQHDLGRHDRHDEEVLDAALLALANEEP